MEPGWFVNELRSQGAKLFFYINSEYVSFLIDHIWLECYLNLMLPKS